MDPLVVVFLVVGVLVVLGIGAGIYYIVAGDEDSSLPASASEEEKGKFRDQQRADKERLRTERDRQREQNAAEKAKQKEIAHQAREAQRAKDKKRAGTRVHSANFGGKTVEIYSNGYVRVGMFVNADTQFQKLVAIEYSGDIQKKTGVGRAGVAVVTLGLNLMTTPNKRGDVWLNVVTDQKTYTLRAAPPTQFNIKAAQGLAAAGQGVLRQAAVREEAAATKVAPAPKSKSPPKSQSLSERLSELKELLNSGMLSESEYQTLRAKAMESL